MSTFLKSFTLQQSHKLKKIIIVYQRV